MTALRNWPDKYDQAPTETDGDALDVAEVAELLPISNALVLEESLPAEVVSRLRKELAFLESYAWFTKENFNRADKCCRAAVALSQTSTEAKYQFFIERIIELHRRRETFGTVADIRESLTGSPTAIE